MGGALGGRNRGGGPQLECACRQPPIVLVGGLYTPTPGDTPAASAQRPAHNKGNHACLLLLRFRPGGKHEGGRDIVRGTMHLQERAAFSLSTASVCVRM